MNENVHNIYVPPQHAEIHLIDANETYLFAGRGSFKTSVGISLYIIRRVFEMPRSTGVIVGLSFEHLNDNTIPPIKSFLASKGFIEGVHYVIGKPPPAHWDKPYAGVVDPKYKHAWTWCNGTVLQLVSLKRLASANGISAQWGVFDEVKFMKKKVLEDEIFPIFRPVEASDKLFKHFPSYMGKFFATDKNADPVKIKWLLNKRKLCDYKKAEIIKNLQTHVINIKNLYTNKKIPAYVKIELDKDEKRLSSLRKNLLYVAEISADDVRPIMGDKWYYDKRKNSTKHDWKVIYKNQDPDVPGETFYPAFKKAVHVYDIENDIDLRLPLIIAADYQHSVAPITVAQISALPGRIRESLNYVNNIYTLHPKGLTDAVKLFNESHKNHVNRNIYYIYDLTARGNRVEADEYWEIVKKILRLGNWDVTDVYTGKQPGHYQKYIDTKEWMENKNGDSMDIRINKRCDKLITSISGSAAKIGPKKKTIKDKSGELETDLDQSETTHFSDTFDQCNDAVLKQKLITYIQQKTPLGFR
jgi:hypothetical protein